MAMRLIWDALGRPEVNSARDGFAGRFVDDNRPHTKAGASHLEMDLGSDQDFERKRGRSKILIVSKHVGIERLGREDDLLQARRPCIGGLNRRCRWRW
jgi:hypothetical protein